MISVIIPTYNRKDKLIKALNSVLYQSFKNIEILIVDDGSTDTTGEYISNLKDNRVRYVRLEHNFGGGVRKKRRNSQRKGGLYSISG